MKRRAKELASTAGHNWALMSAGDKKFFKRQARQEMRAAAQTSGENVAAE